MDTNVKDALDKVRASTQELHRAISDTVAKRGGATKADLEAFAQGSFEQFVGHNDRIHLAFGKSKWIFEQRNGLV
jgi:hypothetical protein